MIDDYSSLPSLSNSEWRHLHPLLFPSHSPSLLHPASSHSRILLNVPQMLPANVAVVSVGHTVSRWLPTITNYTLIAGLCLQLVISPSSLCTWSGGMREEWMWLKWMDEDRRRITANACDAMCWSIMLSSFHRRFERREGREEGENPKNIPASNTPVKVCFFCPRNDECSMWPILLSLPSLPLFLHSIHPYYISLCAIVSQLPC